MSISKIIPKKYKIVLIESGDELNDYLTEVINQILPNEEKEKFITSQLINHKKKNYSPIPRDVIVLGCEDAFLDEIVSYYRAKQKITNKRTSIVKKLLNNMNPISDQEVNDLFHLRVMREANKDDFFRSVIKRMDIPACVDAMSNESNVLYKAIRNKFGIGKDEEKILRDVRKARNTYSHSTINAIEEDVKEEDVQNYLNLYISATKLFQYELLQSDYDRLLEYLEKKKTIIQSQSYSLEELQNEIVGIQENWILNSRLNEDYDLDEHKLYFNSLDNVRQLFQFDLDRMNLFAKEKENTYRLELKKGIEDLTEQLFQKLFNDNLSSNENSCTSTEKVAEDETVYLQQLPKLSNYSEGHLSANQLEEIINNCIIMTDVSAWLEKDSRAYIANELLPALNKYNKKLFIDSAQRIALYHIENNTLENSINRENAHKARIMMSNLHKRGAIVYYDFDTQYLNPIEGLLDTVNRNLGRRFVVICQSKDSSEELLRARNQNVLPLFVVSNHIKVRPFAKKALKMARKQTIVVNDESFNEYKDDNDEDDGEIVEEINGKDENKKIEPIIVTGKKNQPKRAEYELVEITEELLPYSEEIHENSIVHTKTESFTLGNKLGNAGGEAQVYSTNNPNIAAKIYHKNKLTKIRFEKLKLMVEDNPNIDELCWPQDIIYNSKNEFIGFIMPKLDSNYFAFGETIMMLNRDSVRNNKELGLNLWNRLTLVKLCISVSKVFMDLHEKRLIMGDVNPLNFMLNPHSTEKVDIRVIDCDSFQFKGYPCPVGVPSYTSPELIKRSGGGTDFSKILRTVHDEEYGLASMLFRILMLGKSPYASKGTISSDDEARMNYIFGYTSKKAGISGKETPDGPFRFIWNNTNAMIKNNFTDVFTGTKTISAKKWYNDFKKYKDEIQNKIFTDDLIPTRYWDNQSRSFTVDIICEKCGTQTNIPKEIYEKYAGKKHVKLLCNICRSIMFKQREETMMANCSECGKRFESNKWDVENTENLLCPDCLKLLSNQQTVTCTHCGATELINGLAAKRIDRNRFLCSECRKKIEVSCSKCGKRYSIMKARYDNLCNQGKALVCPDCITRWRR